MKRKFLLAAAAAAPLALLGVGPALAQTTDNITTGTSSPISTSSVGNVNIESGGSIGLTAAGIAVTLNSNATVANAGEIGATSIDNVTGIQVQTGNTGSVSNTGSILITDNYTPTVDNNTGLNEPPFAQGNNRIGIQVVGSSGVFTGGITNIGTITIHGDNSMGVDIEAPITGDYQSLQFTAATSTAAAFTTAGSITVTGGEPVIGSTAATPPAIGFYVGPKGGVGGNINFGTITATGYGAQGVVINGPVGGAINFTSGVTSTGYESTSRSSFPTIADQYTALEMSQGGSAVTISANVGGGIILSAPPLTAVTNASTTLDSINGVSYVQDAQPTGTITTFGSAPALVIGSVTNSLTAPVTIGTVNGSANTIQGLDPAGTYGLVVNGSITANGVFDQVNYPNLPGPVSATAVVIGSGAGSPYTTTIQGGVYNSGLISAQAYQANATGIHFTNGGGTPVIVNDGVLQASSIQESTATSGIPQVNVYGILIDPGANVASIVNNSAITANLTGTGGVGGAIGAIIDKSGTLANITNTGSISAQANQTLITAPMPVTTTAIDMSFGTVKQTITQLASTNPTITSSTAYNSTITYNQGQVVNLNGIVYQATASAGVAIDPLDYPSYWRQIGALNPFISGSVLMGSGGSTINLSAGTIVGPVINLGTGSNNAIVINGPSGGSLSATQIVGAVEEVSGAVAEAQAGSLTPTFAGGGNGTLTISINNGTLNDLNPNTEKISGINVGANGLLLVAADPANGTHTDFVTSGPSVFAQGAEIGITLLSVPKATTSVFTILETTPGLSTSTLSAGTFGNAAIGEAPWLYTATAAYVPSDGAGDPSELQLTVTRKTSAEIGFNAAEASALDAILAAAPATPAIQNALLSQTTEAGLKSVYDQLMPSQGQGLFDALDAAAQAVGAMVGTAPEASSRVAGTSLWLQEVNERVNRSGEQTLGSYARLFGVIGGYEVAGPGGGAAGLTLAYFNANELDNADQLGTGVVSSMVEAGAYYRRTVGRFSVSVRGAVGYAWFNDNRIFATLGVTSATNANSASGVELMSHSSWGGVFYDGQFNVNYEQPLFGRYYARPELSADFLELDEGAHSDVGGGGAFDLNIADRDSHRLSGQAVLVLGREWGQASWLRTELRGGYREIFSGNVGDTVASFTGGNPFSLAPDNDRGGWFTAGFSIKGGSVYSYLALEGDIDFRAGEQRYDLRVAGRSIF